MIPKKCSKSCIVWMLLIFLVPLAWCTEVAYFEQRLTGQTGLNNSDQPGVDEDFAYSIHLTEFIGFYPLFFNQKKTVITNGLYFQELDFDFKNAQGQELFDRLYSISLLNVMVQEIKPRWKVLVALFPSLRSDLNQVDSEDFRLYGVTFLEYESPTGGFYRLGYANSGTSGEPMFSPYVSYFRQGERWRFMTRLSYTEAAYRVNEQLELGMLAQFEGDQFHIGNSDVEIDKVRYSDFMAGLTAAWLIEDFRLLMSAGSTVLRRLETLQGEERVRRYEMNNVSTFSLKFSWIPEG